MHISIERPKFSVLRFIILFFSALRCLVILEVICRKATVTHVSKSQLNIRQIYG